MYAVLCIGSRRSGAVGSVGRVPCPGFMKDVRRMRKMLDVVLKVLEVVLYMLEVVNGV